MSRSVIVTGCSRGIGAALVTEFNRRGFDVGGCSRSEESMSQLGTDPRFRGVDVSDDGQVARWSKDLLGAGMNPDLIIANAGVINEPGAFWEVDAAEFDAVIDVNVKGVANTARAFLPAMIEQGRGTFVALSSGWGRSTSAGVAPYCASKYAVEGLIGAISQDLPAGLCAVALSPGVVDTRMLAVAFGASEASQAIDPDLWAKPAVDFLLSLSSADNGQSLTFSR